MRATEMTPDAMMERNVKINHKNKKPKVVESITHYMLKYQRVVMWNMGKEKYVKL